MAWASSQGCPPIARFQYITPVWALALACFGLVWFGPDQARSGAWVAARGDGTLIVNAVSVTKEQSPTGYSVELYGEAGLGHDWALVVAPSMSTQVQSLDPEWSVDEILVGLRRKIFQGNSWAVSYQISSFSMPPTLTGQSRETGIETRFALGKSFGNWGWLNGEIAGRNCSAGQGVRFDATGGVKLPKGDKVILKVFGDGNGCSAPLTRSQISYVSQPFRKVELEIGWRGTLGKEKEGADQGLVMGLWRSF